MKIRRIISCSGAAPAASRVEMSLGAYRSKLAYLCSEDQRPQVRPDGCTKR